MPSTGASTDLARTWASAPAGVDLWPTLTLEHPLWAQPYYLTSAPLAFSAKLETVGNPTVTFKPFPFSLVLPTVDGAGQQDLQVTLTNADIEIAQAVEAAHARPDLRIAATYRVYLSSLGATQLPQSSPLRLEFDGIQVVEEAVSGTAGRSDVLNRRFPGITYDVLRFPGLDR